MKKIIIVSLISVMGILYPLNILAQDWENYPREQRHEYRHRARRGNRTVGTPLDGGLLALLAGGGIAYFTLRKRKKEKR